jgi:hypothetical protein
LRLAACFEQYFPKGPRYFFFICARYSTLKLFPSKPASADRFTGGVYSLRCLVAVAIIIF